METYSPPHYLHCLTLNTGELCRHADEELSQLEFERLRPLLPPSGGYPLLGDPTCRVRLTWLGVPHGQAARFVVDYRQSPVLLAELAHEPEHADGLWRWLSSRRGSTFRCLQAGTLWPPAATPWLGILLMPAALELSNLHLDALCYLARTMGLVVLRWRSALSHNG